MGMQHHSRLQGRNRRNADVNYKCIRFIMYFLFLCFLIPCLWSHSVLCKRIQLRSGERFLLVPLHPSPTSFPRPLHSMLTSFHSKFHLTHLVRCPQHLMPILFPCALHPIPTSSHLNPWQHHSPAHPAPNSSHFHLGPFPRLPHFHVIPWTLHSMTLPHQPMPMLSHIHISCLPHSTPTSTPLSLILSPSHSMASSFRVQLIPLPPQPIPMLSHAHTHLILHPLNSMPSSSHVCFIWCHLILLCTSFHW